MIQSPRQDSANRRAADSSDRKQVRLLIGNMEPPLTEILGAFGREALADRCELVIDAAGTASKLRALIERHHYDACILVLNNIYIDDVEGINGFDVRVRIEHLLDIIENLRRVHRTRVFALSGWTADDDLETKVMAKGAVYYSHLSFLPRRFVSALRTIDLNPLAEEQLYFHWKTERNFQRRYALEMSAEWVFRICEILIPPRIAREELGDALEDIGARLGRGCSRLAVWTRIAVAVVWALLHGLQYSIRRGTKKI